jgi:hypothetical protein
MMTAFLAVDDILAGQNDRSNVWNVNTEQDYHEEKAEGDGETEAADAPTSTAANLSVPAHKLKKLAIAAGMAVGVLAGTALLLRRKKH